MLRGKRETENGVKESYRRNRFWKACENDGSKGPEKNRRWRGCESEERKRSRGCNSVRHEPGNLFWGSRRV